MSQVSSCSTERDRSEWQFRRVCQSDRIRTQFHSALGVPRIRSRLLKRLAAVNLSRLSRGREKTARIRACALSRRAGSTPGSRAALVTGSFRVFWESSESSARKLNSSGQVSLIEGLTLTQAIRNSPSSLMYIFRVTGRRSPSTLRPDNLAVVCKGGSRRKSRSFHITSSPILSSERRVE